MTALDRLIPGPHLLEIDRIDLAVPAARVWERVRHGELAQSLPIRALFAMRSVASGPHASLAASSTFRIDHLKSTLECPGFQILVDDPPCEMAVAAIGKVWRLNIPFVHVADANEYAAFAQPGFIKVAWAIRVLPRGERQTHVELELRVEATDIRSWQRFRRYFRLIGPFSRVIRRSLLRALARDLGAPDTRKDRALPGDDLLPDAGGQTTGTIDIRATPDAIWPWLLQMGGGRAGFYSIDLLDNDGVPSAREIHPELQRLAVGDVIPATPRSPDGFEVLRIEAPRVLLLGGLFDAHEGRQLAFAAPRPPRYWHVTWAFVLDPLDERSTRLHVRARAAFPASRRLHAAWIRRVHVLMQAVQLRNLAARAEGRTAPTGWREVLEGLCGAWRIAFALLTPFLRSQRAHWELDPVTAARALPGDDLIGKPRWHWTHGIEIDAPAEEVWPWIAQIGADRGGFYSYQWLENLAGCRVRNAETIHPEWEIKGDQGLVLHPDVPPLCIVSLERGRHLVTHAPADPNARASGKPWVEASWLFLIEPIGPTRCRFVSRYRVACSNDLATRLAYGPTFVEAIGFAMDRRMLLGVKQRAEASRRRPLAA
jgi:hypothetical protein